MNNVKTTSAKKASTKSTVITSTSNGDSKSGKSSYKGKSNGKNNNKGKQKQLKNPCRIEGHGNHEWDECRANKHSSNYDPYFAPKVWRGNDSNSCSTGRSRTSSGGGSGSATNRQQYAAQVNTKNGNGNGNESVSDSTINTYQTGATRGPEIHYLNSNFNYTGNNRN